jgi:hypothetical protein
MKARTAAGLLAATAVATSLGVGNGGPGLVPAPAAAQAGDPSTMQVVGNFVADDRDEVFSYGFGTTPDHLVQLERTGAPGSELYVGSTDFTVNGLYSPVAGDFDGDGYDEILWYAQGNRQDFMWDFTSPTTVTSRPYTANGADYWPLAGDFTGDGTDDILWYLPGTGQDYLWDYEAGGTYTSSPRRIDGSYWALVGSFGGDATDDVFWYGQGTRADHLWDFSPGGTVASRPFRVDGTYNPTVLDVFNDGWGGDDVVWYAPGTTPDRAWDFVAGTPRSFGTTVNGTYWTVAGDFSGDGHDDVLWMNDTTVNLWDYSAPSSGASSVERWDYTLQPSAFTQGEPGADVGSRGATLTR